MAFARGVDIDPFAVAFSSAHAAELSRAKAIYANAGADPEAVVPMIHAQLASMVDQDMKDVTTGAQVPLDQACALFNEHAGLFVEKIILPAEVREALMAEK
jgi:hypothetical protein